MEVRRLRADEADRWKELRLRALKDAPEAFSTTHAEALARSDEFWTNQAMLYATGSDRAMLVVQAGVRLVGCAGAFVENGVPTIVSMWVEPERRGRRVGAELLGAVARWSRERGYSRLRLWVVSDNYSAIALYEREGFRRTGGTQPMPRDPLIVEIEMVTDLEPIAT